jgi:hypothetical protein
VSDQTREAADRAADAIRELVRLTAAGQDHLSSPASDGGIAGRGPSCGQVDKAVIDS